MRRTGLVAVAMVVGVGFWWAAAEGPLRSPESALRDFYEVRDRGEDQLMDPLILNGGRVLPLVVSALPNKSMRLRRYAIGFLGNGHYRNALPALEKILADQSEIDYFRADALEAIFRIAPERAQVLAPAHVKGEELLGQVARTIVARESPVRWTRSYWQALWHRHE
jgi:hypothetical protein